MWLCAKLRRRVKAFSGASQAFAGFTRYQLSPEVPFTMTEQTYASWRAGWAALAPVQLRCTDPSATGRYFRGRLSGETWASLLEGWRAGDAKATALREQVNALTLELQARAEARSPTLLETAERARGVMPAGTLCWWLFDALGQLVASSQVPSGVGLAWLDFAEEAGVLVDAGARDELAKKRAGLAVACRSTRHPRCCTLHPGDHLRSAAWLRRPPHVCLGPSASGKGSKALDFESGALKNLFMFPVPDHISNVRLF
jgi:hypothetical protein